MESNLEKIIYYTYLIGWILAPMIVDYILHERNVILPSDLGTYGVVIWYAIGIGQTAWLSRKDIRYRDSGKSMRDF